MGIKVANELNKPSVLLENFTWDWIYEPFLRTNIEFKDIILSLEQIYAQSSIHIQCTPFCKNCTSSTKVNPIFRQGRETRKIVLSQLGLNQTDQYTLVTTGGISMHHTLSNLDNDLFLVVPGDFEKVFKQKQMIYIPMNSHIYFPDIVRYANCIVGKVGYGTVSECWGMNIPFLGVFREEFRESEVLKKFCLKNLIFKEIKLSEFLNGTWHNLSIQLASQKLGTKSIERISGASEVSEKIINLLFKKKYNHVSSWE
jgi:hypothetical protein